MKANEEEKLTPYSVPAQIQIKVSSILLVGYSRAW